MVIDPWPGDQSVATTPSEERCLREMEHRLAEDYPSVALEQISDIVSASYERTADSKVPNYRLVLAERHARVRLRRMLAAATTSAAMRIN